jgi:hypothetical protein
LSGASICRTAIPLRVQNSITSAALVRKVGGALLKSGASVVLAGDYNVMPPELDVYAPERWVDDALFRPEVRDAYLDWWRKPDPLVNPLQLLFLGDFVARGLRVFRLGWARKIVAINPWGGDLTAQRPTTFRAALGSGAAHAMHRLVNDQAGRALVLVQRHGLNSGRLFVPVTNLRPALTFKMPAR